MNIKGKIVASHAFEKQMYTFSPPKTHQRQTTIVIGLLLDETAPHLVIIPDISTNLHILKELRKNMKGVSYFFIVVVCTS